MSFESKILTKKENLSILKTIIYSIQYFWTRKMSRNVTFLHFFWKDTIANMTRILQPDSLTALKYCLGIKLNEQFPTFFSHKANWQKKFLISTQTEFWCLSLPRKQWHSTLCLVLLIVFHSKTLLAKLIHFELVVPIRNSVRKRRSAHLSPPIRALM